MVRARLLAYLGSKMPTGRPVAPEQESECTRFRGAAVNRSSVSETLHLLATVIRPFLFMRFLLIRVTFLSIAYFVRLRYNNPTPKNLLYKRALQAV